MEKKPETTKPTPIADVNPQVAFAEAWGKDAKIRAVLTKTGEVRSNLRPSQQVQAQQIKQQYGV